ncbi:hypothetical protein H633G_11373 [Metarhizium anisopliae BRIP 53284]|nr:hypothetical protein H633G_11373 [Metarhizium anisopliae BRIP 53284]
MHKSQPTVSSSNTMMKPRSFARQQSPYQFAVPRGVFMSALEEGRLKQERLLAAMVGSLGASLTQTNGTDPLRPLT